MKYYANKMNTDFYKQFYLYDINVTMVMIKLNMVRSIKYPTLDFVKYSQFIVEITQEEYENALLKIL